MVGLTTEVMIAVIELEASGSKVVSDWVVRPPVMTIVEGSKVVSDFGVGPSVMAVVEGFKVVSATVMDRVTGVLGSGVNEVTVSVCWLLEVGPSSEVVTLTLLKLVVLWVDSVDVSSSEMDEVIDSEVEILAELWVDEASVEDSFDEELGFEVPSVEDAMVDSTDKLVV